MRLRLALLPLSLIAACQPIPRGVDGAGPMAVDSIVLDRSYCIVGFCPSYRLSVTHTGDVRFRPRNFGDTTRVISDTVASAGFTALMVEAARLGFWALPGSIGDSPLCGRMENDYPIATVTVFSPTDRKEVVDYLGCRGAPRALRRLEARIDSVAGSHRWVRRDP
jgi:hypothetical protein